MKSSRRFAGKIENSQTVGIAGKAPLGSKYCHFEKAVNPIKDENGKVVEVYVGWTRVGE